MFKSLKSLYYCARFEMNLMLGNVIEQTELQLDDRYLTMYRMLQQAFKHFDPGDRDFISGMYARRHMIPPAEDVLRQHAAKWATDVILTIELMHEGKLPPNSFTPLIQPWEIDYYYERIQAYTAWLLSYDPREQQIPMPFFHMIAAERLSKLMKDPVLVAQAPQRIAEKQAAMVLERAAGDVRNRQGHTGQLRPACAYI